jgi:putative peptidoglycan lipid II flippase
MKKVFILMFLILILSKIFGFGREILLSYYYGVSNITDAYYTAILITSLSVGFLGVAIMPTFIPR